MILSEILSDGDHDFPPLVNHLVVTLVGLLPPCYGPAPRTVFLAD
ncbi:hypothetical protein ACWC9T_03130 [Kitasatospora sp. NPDC001159]